MGIWDTGEELEGEGQLLEQPRERETWRSSGSLHDAGEEGTVRVSLHKSVGRVMVVPTVL